MDHFIFILTVSLLLLCKFFYIVVISFNFFKINKISIYLIFYLLKHTGMDYKQAKHEPCELIHI